MEQGVIEGFNLGGVGTFMEGAARQGNVWYVGLLRVQVADDGGGFAGVKL